MRILSGRAALPLPQSSPSPGASTLRAVLPFLTVLACYVASPASAAADAPLLALTDPRGGATVDVLPAPRVLHVVYFATWCPNCVEELAGLADLEDRWAERGYRLVLVAVQTRQTASRLVNFIDASKPPGRFLFDGDGLAARAMKVDQLPTHVLFGPGGAELARAGSLAEIREPLLRGLQAGGPDRP